MFCMKCGSQIPDGTSFCTECGTATPYNVPISAAAPRTSKKPILIIAIVAAIVVIAIICVVAFVTCSGRGTKINLNSLVNDEPAKAAEFIEGLELVKLYNRSYYTPTDMKDTVKSASAAFSAKNKKGAADVAEDVAKQSPWAVSLYEDNKGEEQALRLKDIQGKGDPSQVIYLTYRKLDEPTVEDIFKIVQEVTPIDTAHIGSSVTTDGKSKYDSPYMICFGYAEGPDSLIRIRADEIEGVYEITVWVNATGESGFSKVEGWHDEFEENFSDCFSEEFVFPKK